MTEKKPIKELNPLEQSIKEFLKDQDDYGRYLEKLRKKDKLPFFPQIILQYSNSYLTRKYLMSF